MNIIDVISVEKNTEGDSHPCVLCAKLLQSCPTLCNPMDWGFPGSSVHGRQEHWSGLPCPPPGDLLNPGVKPASLASLVVAGECFTI